MTAKKFVPRPGQVDFTHIRWAPVVNCVLRYHDMILLVQRNPSLRLYPGYWNGVSGFIDDDRSLEEKVKQEIGEEVGIAEEHVRTIKLGTIFHQDEPKYHKTWIIHPVLVDVDTDMVRLDWEAATYQWVKPEEATQYTLVPGFERVLTSLGLI